MKRWIALCLLVSASPALAEAKLVRSAPAAGAKVKSPRHVVLTFSEALEPAYSGALLLDADGRNLSGGPIAIDGVKMTLSPERLAAGRYRVEWHAVGHDGKRSDGRITFAVR
jgi:methionine-rich copper-binding protein CopC